jgi:two-component system response regulator (stage 0 sporulation protein F)
MNRQQKILYVDDEPLNLMIFEANFKKKFHVLTTESASQGLEQLRANPDTLVVISDMKMPGMNGIEFIRLAKKEFPAITFFILTGFDISEEIAGALYERLILRYFQKPFNLREIETAIGEIIP